MRDSQSLRCAITCSCPSGGAGNMGERGLPHIVPSEIDLTLLIEAMLAYGTYHPINIDKGSKEDYRTSHHPLCMLCNPCSVWQRSHAKVTCTQHTQHHNRNMTCHAHVRGSECDVLYHSAIIMSKLVCGAVGVCMR